VSINQISYTIGSFILFVGIGPFFFNPLAHAFGRRPIYLTSLAGLVVMATLSGFSKTYPMIMALRSLSGLFAAVPIGLGSVVVCDLFYQHERGFFMGILMVFQVSGAHLGPMLGGYVYSGINWHWCFFIPAIIGGVLLVSFAVTVPETLYFRNIESLQRPHMNLYQQELIRKKRSEGKRLTLDHFRRPFKMLRYPSIVLPSLYYSVTSGYANIVFIISSSMLFHYYYGFHSWQTGLLMGTPLTLGSWIGEFGAGGFSDWVTEKRALKRGGKRIPEDRLYAMLPGVLLAPLGLFVEGMTLRHRAHWIGAGLGIGIASAGFQIITTVTYAYTADVSLEDVTLFLEVLG
jgi:MFS family permease